VSQEPSSSLSWGHGPPPQPPLKRGGISRAAFIAIGVVFVLAGIGLSFVSRTGPTVDASTRAAITELLDRRVTAARANDLDRFMGTVDPARVFLRNCEQQRFEAEARLGLSSRAPTLVLGATDTYGSYVRAWVHDPLGWQRIFLRNDGYRWYLSEPTSAELGDEQSRDYSGIKVTFRDVESDLADAVGHEAELILPSVMAQAPTPPTRLFSVRIATLTGTAGRCFVAGRASGYGATVLTLVQVRLTERLDRLSADTTDTLRHEALHWVQLDHSSDAMMAMDWWLIEGWPFLIANDPSRGLRAASVCAPGLPTYSTLRFGPGPDDPPEVVTREYVVASLLVERLGTVYGAKAYWHIVDAFAKEIEATRSYQSAIATDGPSFYAAWSDEARRQYCS